MAFRATISDSTHLLNPVHGSDATLRMTDFYNVTMAVGRVASNMMADVMLVQFLLSNIYESDVALNPPTKGTLKIDGLFGPVTQKWIREFQRSLRADGYGVFVDGRIDREYDNSYGTLAGDAHYSATYILPRGQGKRINIELMIFDSPLQANRSLESRTSEAMIGRAVRHEPRRTTDGNARRLSIQSRSRFRRRGNLLHKRRVAHSLERQFLRI